MLQGICIIKKCWIMQIHVEKLMCVCVCMCLCVYNVTYVCIIQWHYLRSLPAARETFCSECVLKTTI